MQIIECLKILLPLCPLAGVLWHNIQNLLHNDNNDTQNILQTAKLFIENILMVLPLVNIKSDIELKCI